MSIPKLVQQGLEREAEEFNCTVKYDGYNITVMSHMGYMGEVGSALSNSIYIESENYGRLKEKLIEACEEVNAMDEKLRLKIEERA